MLWNYLTLLREIRWDDLLDIGFATVLLSIGIHVIRTARTRGVGLGLLFFGGVFLAANHLELKLTIWILQGIAAVIVLVVVVVYQTEIRRFLEHFPNRILHRSSRRKEAHSGVAQILAEAVNQLSTEGWGALIVLPGWDRLEGIITEGTRLDGLLSKTLLLSIFDPDSPGHDGALIVRGDRVERFGTRLPLSDHEDQLKDRGTRHAAALGLSEKSDALILVVSEETARISLARDGHLRAWPGTGDMSESIDEFLLEHSGTGKSTGRFGKIYRWAGFEGLFALIIAVILWLVLVPGSVVEKATYAVPIEVQNIPEGFLLSEVSPAKVAVTLTGERRKLFQVNAQALEIRLDGTLTRFGRQTFPITTAHLLLPPDIEIAGLAPEEVRVLVRKVN